MPVKEIVTKLTVDNADVKKKLSDAEKTVLKFSAVIAGISASMSAAAVYTAQWQDATVKASRAAGVSVETFSSLAVAAEKSNVSTEELSKSLGKLNNTTPELSKNLASVGISVRDTSGHLKTADTLLGEVSETMKKYKNPADQAAVATKVFGEEGGKLVNLLKDGKAGLAAARVEAEKYGLVVTESAAAAAEKFNDDLTETKNALKGLTSSIGESIIAWTNQGGIMNTVRDTIASVTHYWRSLSDDTKNVIITAGAVALAISGIVTALIALKALAPLVGDALKTMFGPIGAIIGVVVAGVTALISGFSKYGHTLDKFTTPANQSYKKSLENVSLTLKKFPETVDDATKSFSGMAAGAEKAQRPISYIGTVVAWISKQFAIAQVSWGAALEGLALSWQFIAKKFTETKEIVAGTLSGDVARVTQARNRLAIIERDAAEQSLLLAARTAGAIQRIERETSIRYEDEAKKRTETAKKESEGVQRMFGQRMATFANPVIEAYNNIETASAKMNGATAEELDRLESKHRMVQVSATSMEKQVAIGYAKLAQAAVTQFSSIGDAMKAVTTAITGASKYNTQVQLRDLEVLTIRSKKAYEEMRAAADAEETAKAAALEKSYDDQINALKDAEAEKTAAIEFESKQRLLLNDEEYQTKKAQAEAAHAAFMEAERVRFEEEKALMDERTVDKEQRRLNEGVMDANWQAYVKAQEALLQQQLNDLAKNSGDKKTKIDSEAKAKLSAMTKQNAEDIKALEAAKAEALKKTEEEKNKRLAQIDADRTAQEKAEEKRRLQIQYDAEVQDFEQTKAVKITDVIISGITAAANAFAALAPIPFIGWGLGIAAAAAITGATAASVSQINSQRPVKPAALIAEDGGFAVGARHSMGGIPTEIEGGELITSRGRTKALFDALDAGAFGGGGDGPAVVFQNCTFSASNPEEMAEMINNAIGAEVRRLGIAGA